VLWRQHMQQHRTSPARSRKCVAAGDGEMARLNGLKLMPGMPVEAFIQTGERTALSYLTKPL
jgi:multidrug efflux pump subunit AcrA (membrane-fusion protein)